MDLIDRGAAIEAMKKWATQPVIMKSRYFDPKGKAIVLDMIGTVEGQPSVHAVPLEKLCEWLGMHVVPPVSDCLLTTEARTAAWKVVLNKFVEEQDAADLR